MTDFPQIYLGPAVLLLAWFLFRHRTRARELLCGVWLVCLVVLGTIGAAMWSQDDGYTRLASCLIGASPMFLGPLLILSAREEWHWVWSILGSAVLPWATLIATVLALWFSGEIWQT